MRDSLKKIGFDTGLTTTPIIPVVIGDDMTAFRMWKSLFDKGVFVTPVVSPAVPPGRALIRVSMMASHTKRHVEEACAAFQEAGEELGIIRKGPGEKAPYKARRMTKMWNAMNRWMKNLWNWRRLKRPLT